MRIINVGADIESQKEIRQHSFEKPVEHEKEAQEVQLQEHKKAKAKKV